MRFLMEYSLIECQMRYIDVVGLRLIKFSSKYFDMISLLLRVVLFVYLIDKNCMVKLNFKGEVNCFILKG